MACARTPPHSSDYVSIKNQSTSSIDRIQASHSDCGPDTLNTVVFPIERRGRGGREKARDERGDRGTKRDVDRGLKGGGGRETVYEILERQR